MRTGTSKASALLADPDVATVTGTWTRGEVAGALVRAARTGRGDEKLLLALLDGDLAGPVIVLGPPQDQIEQHALQLVRRNTLRAMDAWHLAVAAIVVPPLLEPGEPRAFASRDEAQRQVAEELGFVAI
jgi:predicted nucleic acid-binding protein